MLFGLKWEARLIMRRARNILPGVGLEPTRPYGQGILSPQCLPFHHPGDRNGTVMFPVMFVNPEGRASIFGLLIPLVGMP